MQKISDLKVDQLKFLLRQRELATAGSRSDLILRLVEFEGSEEVDMSHETRDHVDKAAITQLQNEMTQLKEMMSQLINQQTASTSAAARIQPVIENTMETANDNIQLNSNTRQASVKEIAKSLPEFDPSESI